MSHTILLVQPNPMPQTRTYSDYESVNECMEGVCKIYEEHLKRLHPNTPTITYDISQLFDFVDQVPSSESCLFQTLMLFVVDEGHQLPCLPEVHQHIRAVQQGMDQGEDLRTTSPGCRHLRLDPPLEVGSHHLSRIILDFYSYQTQSPESTNKFNPTCHFRHRIKSINTVSLSPNIKDASCIFFEELIVSSTQNTSEDAFS